MKASLGTLALLFVVATSGCGDTPNLGFGVAATLLFDETVDDATLARVTSLRIQSSGDETYERNVTLGRAALRAERFVYRPEAATRRLTLAVSALDDAGLSLVSGRSAELPLAGGETTLVQIRLARDLVDGGEDDLAVRIDLAGSDLSISPTADLAQPACPSQAFCARFDDAALTPTWTLNLSGAGSSITVDGTHVHDGLMAAHLHTAATGAGGSASAELATQGAFTIARPDFWVRAWFYQPSPGPTASSTLFGAFQGMSPYSTTGLDQFNGKLALRNGISTPNGYVLTTTAMPLDRWFCLEWHFVVGNPGMMAIGLDSTVLPSTLSGDTMSGPALGYFTMSTASGANEPAHDLWIDSLVVSDTRVGCAF